MTLCRVMRPWLVITASLCVVAATASQRPADPVSPEDLKTAIDNLGRLDYEVRMNAARTVRRAAAPMATRALMGAVQRLVFSHVPLWPFAQGRESEYIGDPALEQLLREAGVDLYLSGHHHAFYPGHKDGIHLVSQSCVGAGPRRLIGSAGRSPRSITLIETEGDALRLAAFQGPDFTPPIDWRTLPESIRSPAAELMRADLVERRLETLDVPAQTARRAMGHAGR